MNKEIQDSIDIIEQIISKPPLLPNKISLDFAAEEKDLDLIDVFDFLLIFLSKLCKKMYSNNFSGKIELSCMTNENIIEINKYFNSIGFQLEVDKIPFNNDYIDEINDNKYDKIIIIPGMKLNKLYMPLKSGNMIYLIRFDIYNIY